MRWLRLYSDIINDAKLSKLSDGLFRFWIGTLIIARKNEGVLPPCEEIAFLLRTSVRKAKTNLESLEAAGLIDQTPGGMRPHNWDLWQPQSDDQRGRQKRHRDNRRNVASNVTQTPQSRRDSDSDTEGESESDESESRENARALIGRVKTSWPVGFQLTPTHIQYAASQNINRHQAEIAFNKFRNYCQANGNEYADWDFAVRSWLDKEHRHNGREVQDRNRIDDRL